MYILLSIDKKTQRVLWCCHLSVIVSGVDA